MNTEEKAINDWVSNILSNPDWIEVENRPWANESCRFSISRCSGKDFVFYDERIKMRFFWNEKEKKLAGTVKWDDRTEGPPGCSHGASIMTVFDEVLAYPVWRLGEAAFTANVNINLRKPVPFCAYMLFSSSITNVSGRKRFTAAQITDSSGTLYAEATGIWVTSNGIGRSMAVHDAVIAADKLRLEQGDTELRAPFSPPASLSAAPGEDNVLFGGPGLAEQFFDLSSEDGAHLHLKSNL